MIGVELLVEIQFLARQGLNKTQIARRLGVDRKTVRKSLALDVDEFVKNPAKWPSILDPYKRYLQYRLEMLPELSAVRLYREISTLSCPGGKGAELLPDIPYQGSERTVRRYVSEIRPRNARVYRPIETLPGEQAQADWGHFGHITLGGVRRPLYAFSFVLSYSRVRYVEFTTSQDMVTFLTCLKHALEYIAGVPQVVLFDNAKTVVSERVGSVIQFSEDLLRFAARYKFKPEACWLNDPESKGKVESGIKYVRWDFFYGRPVTDPESLNREALEWCDEVANEKVHEATMEVPSDRLSEERKALAALPERPVSVFQRVTRFVRKDCTFSFETNQYSVPAAYARKRIEVCVYPDRLEAFAGGERVAVHGRCMERGRLVLNEAHYQDRFHGLRQRKDSLQTQFESIGDSAPAYLKGLARSRQGHLREQARQILALAAEYGNEAVNLAMSRANHFGQYSYGTLKQIVLKQLQVPGALPVDPRQLIQAPYNGPYVEVERRSLDDYVKLVEVAGR